MKYLMKEKYWLKNEERHIDWKKEIKNVILTERNRKRNKDQEGNERNEKDIMTGNYQQKEIWKRKTKERKREWLKEISDQRTVTKKKKYRYLFGFCRFRVKNLVFQFPGR